MKLKAPAKDLHEKLQAQRGRPFPCQGRGTCGKCKVRLLEAVEEPMSRREEALLSEQERAAGFRLACFLRGEETVAAIFEEAGQEDMQILLTGQQADFTLAPLVEQGPLDTEGLGAAAQDLVGIAFDGTVLDKRPAQDGLYAGVVDIGTTTIAVSLVDLLAGQVLTSKSQLNPQRAFGDDVMTRISAVQADPKNLAAMQEEVLTVIRSLGRDLCLEAGLDPSQMYAFMVAGNAVMNHLLLGVSPVSIGLSPYELGFQKTQVKSFQELGLDSVFGAGRLVTLPNISAFVGGDLTAGLLATNLRAEAATSLLLDIGTNGEMLLKHEGQVYSTSCAAGPALEGMNISCGMQAQSGAIEEAQMKGSRLRCVKIKHKPALGLCGSGLLAVVREFLRTGLITSRGNIVKASQVPADLAHFLVPGERALWVEKRRNIRLTQRDVRQLQLAKGAILSGVQCLLRAAGVSAGDVEKVYIAGQFGRHLEEGSLLGVGLLPQDFQGKVAYVGNTSLSGSVMALLDRKLYRAMDQLTQDVRHVELSFLDDYDRVFAYASLFPKED